jgi:3-hydroxyisobutyrate dehydrogenase-like beta-hydroxyacid dehydrogenase
MPRRGPRYGSTLSGDGLAPADARRWRCPSRGATQATTPAGAATSSDIVQICLFDEAALDAVYDGPDGLLADGCTGRLSFVGGSQGS